MAADRIVSVRVAGRAYRLPEPEEISSDECYELERISGECRQTFLRALGRLNPDAWRAWVLVAMRRVDPSTRDDALDDEPFREVLSTVAITEAGDGLG